MALAQRWGATILDIKSPLEFSVRAAGCAEAFFLFKESLNEHYSRHCSTLKLGIEQARSLKAGETIVAFHDSRWCRALVQSTHQYQVTVWLLDYGRMDLVTVDKLYKLDDESSNNKPFALRCHLANLKEATTPQWLAAATQQMEGLKDRYGDEVQIEQLGDIEEADENDNVIFTDENDRCFKSLPVNVMWSYTEASPLDPPVHKTVNLLHNLKTMQFFEPFEELMDSLTEATDLLTTSDEIEFSKRSVEKEEHDPNFRWLNPEIPPEQEFLARCTHVDDSGQIYLQLENKKFLIKSVHDDLSCKYMGTKSGGMKPKEGSECIARWRDGRWYRGRILSYGPFQDCPASSEEVLVLFVDFGNTSIIKKKNIRTNLSYKNIPIQAVRVVLNALTPKQGGQWSLESLDFIHHVTNSDRNVDHSPVRVIVVENHKMPLKVNIEILDKKGKWIDVSQLLVARGEAVAVESKLVKRGIWLNVESRLVESRLDKRWEEESNGVGFTLPRTSTSNPVQVSSKVTETSVPRKLYFRAAEDLWQHAQVGDTYKCKLATVVAYNKVVVELVVESTEVVKLPEADPVIGVEIELGVIAVDDEEEVATVVVSECLWKQEEPLSVQMIAANPPVAHIVDGDGKPVYSSLQEEGFIELKTRHDLKVSTDNPEGSVKYVENIWEDDEKKIVLPNIDGGKSSP